MKLSRDDKEIIQIFGAVVLVLVVVAYGLYVYLESVNRARCADIAEQTGHPTKYSEDSGCYVQRDGEWRLLSEPERRSSPAPVVMPMPIPMVR